MSNGADIFQAIADGDLARAKRLTESDAAVAEACDEQGLSAVTQARYQGREDILEALLAVRSELDVFEAASVGRTERVRELVEKDPSLVEAYSPDGYTALHLAAFFGHPELARLLLERGADPEAVARNPMQVMPLHSAAASGQLGIARQLLDAGAAVNARQELGFTPLHASAQNGDVELTRLLLERGADPAQATEDGRRAADFAAPSGSAEVRALLENGPHG